MERFIQCCMIIMCLLLIGFLSVLPIRAEDVLQKEKGSIKEQMFMPAPEKSNSSCDREGCLTIKKSSFQEKVILAAHPGTIGVLVLAHGMHTHGHGEHLSEEVPSWNAAVLDAVKPLRDKYQLEVAFGMADPGTIKEAVQKLEEKGVTDVIVIPLFVSSHSPIIGNSRYILGLQKELPATTDVKSLPRLESKIKFHMTGALDDSILVAEILLERAKELSSHSAGETVIIVGHGPNDENENRLWLKDMEKLAWYVREKGCFKEVKVATWRSDAPKEIRDKATQELRTMVQMSGKDERVIIIPHLLSSGGVEGEIVDALKGLTYDYNGKTLLPHDNITKWVEMEVEAELMNLR